MDRPELQPEWAKLWRSDLPDELSSAIEAAEAAQRRGDASWEQREHHRALRLPGGSTFLPDEREALSGGFGYVAGIVLAIVGVAFTQMGLTDDEAGRWMVVAGPVCLAVGAWMFWTGRTANAAAKEQPVLSGAYLVGRTLLYRHHDADLGHLVFPAADVERVAYEPYGPDNRLTLRVYYLDDSGRTACRRLCDRNLESSINQWLAETS